MKRRRPLHRIIKVSTWGEVGIQPSLYWAHFAGVQDVITPNMNWESFAYQTRLPQHQRKIIVGCSSCGLTIWDWMTADYWTPLPRDQCQCFEKRSCRIPYLLKKKRIYTHIAVLILHARNQQFTILFILMHIWKCPRSTFMKEAKTYLILFKFNILKIH